MRLRLALVAGCLAMCGRSSGLQPGDHVDQSLKGGEARVYEVSGFLSSLVEDVSAIAGPVVQWSTHRRASDHRRGSGGQEGT